METDVLGSPYVYRRIALAPDDEGDVVATLVRLSASAPSQRAVLYVHGFVDYFFQTHLAEFFTARGYDFYALDLRKHGRSLLAHQTPNFCRDISDYYPEIDEAVRIIRDEDGHDTVLLHGHSTGGLTAALWAHRMRGSGLIQGLLLNSPFVEFNEPWLVRRGLTPIVSAIGARRPKTALPQKLGTTYGLSIHRDHHGEWNYDLAWKPLNGYTIYAGWARAVHLAHRRIQAGLAIDVPIMVAASARSYRGRSPKLAHHADAVLNVADIARHAPSLGPKVTFVQIEGGKHDLVLSPRDARQRYLDAIDTWLRLTLGVDPTVAPTA